MSFLQNGIAVGPGTYIVPAGLTNVTFSGRSADGSKVGEVNGGAGCEFSGTANIAAIADSLVLTVPAAGSEESLSFTSDGDGLTALSGNNGDTFVAEDFGEGGEIDADSFGWLTLVISGTDQSVTGAGTDGSFTLSWSTTTARRDTISSLTSGLARTLFRLARQIISVSVANRRFRLLGTRLGAGLGSNVPTFIHLPFRQRQRQSALRRVRMAGPRSRVIDNLE